MPPFVKPGQVLKSYTVSEVAKHAVEGDLWVVIDSYVFEYVAPISSRLIPPSFHSLTCRSLPQSQQVRRHAPRKFSSSHSASNPRSRAPDGQGGAYVLLDEEVAGKDCTDIFFGLHKSDVLTKYARYLVGQVEGQKSSITYPAAGVLSVVPFAEPTWLSTAYRSPYFTEDHRKLALAMRQFVDARVIPEAHSAELSGDRPSKELVKEMSDNKILHMRLGPGAHLNGLTLPGGMKGEKYDYLAELVVTQELARMGARGFQDGLSAGMWIGLTPILNYGTAAQKASIIGPVLAGDKHICLAISEPFAGSDVAGMKTKAVLSKDGKHFIVNGTKKWITNGTWSDYFTTAVRTSAGGLTMMLIPRIDGVETKLIKTSYSSSAGTAYVTFDNVMVPVENVIGEVDKGFAIVLSNFNHERQVMNHFTVRQMRQVTEASFKWAHQRKVFGKALIDQPVIRAKFADMFARCESAQAWLEQITYQMDGMTYAQQSEHLAGPIALLKAHVTASANEVASHAVQIWGGRGITKAGMGGLIEMYQRTTKYDSILGGSEEILADLGVRQASKLMLKSRSVL